MQLCDLDDLYNKFDVIKMLRIGSMDRPHFACSDGFSIPDSEGEIVYEKIEDNEDNELELYLAANKHDTAMSSGVGNHLETANTGDTSTTARSTSMDRTHASNSESIIKGTDVVNDEATNEVEPELNPMSESFKGPLTRCLEEDDDILYDADKYVPNKITIRIKVYLPNKNPLFIVVKQDATVQDTIEMTIRKSNALTALFQKEYQERKEAYEQEQAEKNKDEITIRNMSPPLEETEYQDPHSPRHNSLDGLSEFLENGNLQSSRREISNRKEDLSPSIRIDDIIGVDAMNLLTDAMAYELRMETGDGECDMDFPALERGGILMNFYEDDTQGFCLVPVPDYQPRVATPTSSDQNVEIRLMFEDKVFNLSFPANSTCRQLLNEACHSLYPGRVYELTVAPEDKERLKMMSDVVNENEKLCDLDITQFRIRLKQFYDGPKVVSCPTYSYNTDSGPFDDEVDQTTYMFTNFEAGKYKEWPVIKITSKGKRRKRIFAIDRDEVFIYPITSLSRCAHCVTSSQTTIYISNILVILPLNNPPDAFELKYLDDDYDSDESEEELQQEIEERSLKVRFETMSVSDCCEIVNRIEHLMRNSR